MSSRGLSSVPVQKLRERERELFPDNVQEDTGLGFSTDHSRGWWALNLVSQGQWGGSRAAIDFKARPGISALRHYRDCREPLGL